LYKIEKKTKPKIGFTLDELEEKEKKYLITVLKKDIDGLIFISTCKNHLTLKNYKNLLKKILLVLTEKRKPAKFSEILKDVDSILE
jgi:DNA-binding LacI/PurR family transcriptional regulator